jgi:Right handed beta helix region
VEKIRNPLGRLALLGAAAAIVSQVLPGSIPRARSGLAPTCTRFAALSGSDRARGTKRRPFHSVQRLVRSLRAGDTGCLRAGSYTTGSGGATLNFLRSGRPNRRITLRAYPGERASVVGIVRIAHGADFVTLNHLKIEGTGDQNTVKVEGAHDVVENSNITNHWRGESCMLLGNNDGWGRAVKPVIRRNVIHECGSTDTNLNHEHGIYAANVLGGEIVDNVIWGVSAKAIQLYPNAQRTRFAHNIIDGGPPSVRGGVAIGGDDRFASSDNIVEYNVLSYAQTYNVYASWEAAIGTGNIVRRNCLWAGLDGNIDRERSGFSARKNVVADPLFVDRTDHDYRLGTRSRCRRIPGVGVRWRSG